MCMMITFLGTPYVIDSDFPQLPQNQFSDIRSEISFRAYPNFYCQILLATEFSFSFTNIV